MWYTSGKHRALKSVWCPRAAKRNHYWKREERGDLNNWTCFLESAIEKLNPEVFKIYFLTKFWITGGWVEIWTIRHGSWWSFEEERVEGEQKNKLLNNEITICNQLQGFRSDIKKVLRPRRCGSSFVRWNYLIRWIKYLWNEIPANTIQFEGVDSLLWIKNCNCSKNAD